MHQPLLVFLPLFPCPFVVCKGLFVAAISLHVSFFLINAHVQNVAWTIRTIMEALYSTPFTYRGMNDNTKPYMEEL